MRDPVTALCSWCGRQSTHRRVEQNTIRRDVHRCNRCGGRTLRCRLCGAMARGRAGYDEELCFLHDGTLPRFEALPRTFRSLDSARAPEPSNGWGLAAAGAAIGAVLTGGSPWGAVAGLSAARAIRTYVEPVREFRIEKVREGTGRPLVFVDGFLTQSSTIEDWREGLDRAFGGRPWYRVSWESQSLAALGSAVSKAAGALRMARSRSAFLLFEIVRNPWHVALWKAERTGRLLGFLLARTRLPERCVMMGHSLGARVIFEAVQTLGAIGSKKVSEVHLLAAAVDRRAGPAWDLALRGASRIVNYHSANDGVLKYLYRPGNFFLSDPAGLEPVEVRGVRNVDVTDRVRGHTAYPEALGDLLSPGFFVGGCRKLS